MIAVRSSTQRRHDVSIQDVADLVQVSRAAVSLVLNDKPIRISEEKRQAIKEAARRLGYQPHVGARRLIRQKMDTIGLVFPYEPAVLSEMFHFELTRNIVSAARERNYDILLDLFHSTSPAVLSARPGRVDGTILIWDRHSPEDVVETLERSGQPTIVLGGGYMERKPQDFIDVDLKSGALAVTNHLIKLGHRRIAFLAGIPSPQKLLGFREAHSQAGIPVNEDLILNCGMSEPEVAIAIDALLRRNTVPTAIVATNDTLAIRTIKVLLTRSKHVPQDISVVGFDDIETANLVMPHITTVRIPLGEMAEIVVSSLIRRIEHEDAAHVQRMLPTKLVVRESSAPPSKQ
ncbi:MAG TPA: LacI family DNA-binding transcriptional regulator [Verrucomicrobiae bacterium]|nr:LacI family DNA-binding transcriptional regulator [Verrucomicrobiae bacterium]